MSFRDRTGPKSAKFPAIGTVVEGTVVALADAPVPEFVNGRPAGPKFNVDGSLFTQLDVTLDTDAGKVVLHTGGAIFDAIADALDAVGIDDLVTGHRVAVTYIGNGPKAASSEFPPKQYSAVVTPAA